MIPLDVAARQDVAVVGGGPVGFWFACQTKFLHPEKEIIVLEKYRDYQRTDIRLNIEKSSLEGIPNDPELKKIIEQWPKHAVPIAEMQQALEDRARALGVTVVKEFQADPAALPTIFPNAQVFVGADGARSSVRSAVFNNALRFDSNLQYLAQVQYVVNRGPENYGSFQKLDNLTVSYQTEKFAEHIVRQRIRHISDTVSHVSLQIFINKGIYDQMGDASFRKPYYFNTDLDRVPEVLRAVLIKWWGARKELHHETILQVEDPKLRNKITVIALNSTVAKDVLKQDAEGRTWALVGDAAASFPYFRAVNNGLLLGTKLASQLFNPKPSWITYSRYTLFRTTLEHIKAHIKNLFINLYAIWLKVSNRVPWQVSKFQLERRNQIHISGTEIWNQLSGAHLSPPLEERTLLTSLEPMQPVLMAGAMAASGYAIYQSCTIKPTKKPDEPSS